MVVASQYFCQYEWLPCQHMELNWSPQAWRRSEPDDTHPHPARSCCTQTSHHHNNPIMAFLKSNVMNFTWSHCTHVQPKPEYFIEMLFVLLWAWSPCRVYLSIWNIFWYVLIETQLAINESLISKIQYVYMTMYSWTMQIL